MYLKRSVDSITFIPEISELVDNTNRLYNIGGTLYFNGSAVGAGGGDSSNDWVNANDYATYTTLNSAINTVQNNVSSLPDSAANDYNTYTTLISNINEVQSNLTSIIASAPSTLDTLAEIAAALENDANIAVTLTTSISTVQNNVVNVTANVYNTYVTLNNSINTVQSNLSALPDSAANDYITYEVLRSNLITSIEEDTTPILGGNLTLNSYSIIGTGDINIIGNITADLSNCTISDILTIGSQVIYPQDLNGFSVNENFDPSNNALQTAYHFASGIGRETVAFTLARTNQFTNGFGIYGSSANNTLVMFGEQTNTNFEWRKGVGIRPLDLDGGSSLMSLSSGGDLTILGNLTSTNLSNTWVNANDYTTYTTLNSLINTVQDNVSAMGGGSVWTEDSGRVYYIGKVVVNSNIAQSEQFYVNGNAKVSSDFEVGGTLTESSSVRLKENIVPLNSQLNALMKLRPVEYDKIESKIHEFGLIAEEVANVLPQVVSEGNTSIQYTRLIPTLIKAIQELTEKVDKLESK